MFLSFQYISCYCLSFSSLSSLGTGINFNTSHVTVYLSACNTSDKRFLISIHLMLLFITYKVVIQINWRYFNTSHVTVYRMKTKKTNGRIKISIHLMLLFIIALFTAIYKPLKFQYISCYCLS